MGLMVHLRRGEGFLLEAGDCRDWVKVVALPGRRCGAVKLRIGPRLVSLHLRDGCRHQVAGHDVFIRLTAMPRNGNQSNAAEFRIEAPLEVRIDRNDTETRRGRCAAAQKPVCLAIPEPADGRDRRA